METLNVTENTKALENNVVNLTGEIVSEKRYSHEVYGEKFYIYDLSIARLSGENDLIPLTISERLMNLDELNIGTKVTVEGQFRSYNKHEENKNRLILSVFVRSIDVLTEEDGNKNDNSIRLDGFICKKPNYRKTPLGREITDLLIAVNRPYGKSDYIPCIVWGRNARYTSDLEVSTHVIIYGRIQSRTYKKKISETETEDRVAYEVSVSKIDIVSEEK